MMMSDDKVGGWVKNGQNHDDVILECPHSMTLHYILSVMPIELILMWQKYPWPFGQFGCRFATAISELVTHVTIIKIIIFTVER